MDKLDIDWREELIKLFPDITTKTKGENDDWCPSCNGVGLKRVGNNIVGCTACGHGVIKACVTCGGKREPRSYYTRCESCRQVEREEKERERFKDAEKIPYKEYQGKFLWNDQVIEKEELEDELYFLEDPPKYIWGTKKGKVFKEISLEEIISNMCEDGYEDMSSFFDFKEADFLKAQKLLDRWLLKHDRVLDVYYEDHSIAVLLDDILQEIKQG